MNHPDRPPPAVTSRASARTGVRAGVRRMASALTAATRVIVVTPDRPDPPTGVHRLIRLAVTLIMIAWALTWLGRGIAEMSQQAVPGGNPDLDGPAIPGGIALLMAVPFGLAVVLARWYPLTGWRVLIAGFALSTWLVRVSTTSALPFWQGACLVAVLAAVGYGYSTRPSVPVAVGLLSLLGLQLLSTVTGLAPGPAPPVVVGAPLLVGVLLAGQLRTRYALLAQERRAELAQAERAALAERTRIAREMHDIVGHHMSLIAVRCETAPYRLPGLPEPAATEFTEVAAAARSAVTEMQALLGVLRAGDQETDRAPQPDLGGLGALVSAARDAGVHATLSMPPELADGLAAAVQLSAYRIVQEALTNAGRHAPGCTVDVQVRRDRWALRVEVRSGPPAPGGRPAGPAPGGGHGLAGMRERAALHGGTLAAGPGRRGGFTVTARLPLSGGRGRPDGAGGAGGRAGEAP